MELEAADALILIVHEMYFHMHPQMHAWANYGVSTCSPDPFIALMSKITVIYNNMGVEGYKDYVNMAHTLGVSDAARFWNTHEDSSGHGKHRKGVLARIQ